MVLSAERRGLSRIAQTCPKLETSMVYFESRKSHKDQVHEDGLLGPTGLQALVYECPNLSMLAFSGSKVVGNPGVDALFQSSTHNNLKALYFRDNDLISDAALRAIGSSSISTLELESSYNVSDVGLGFLANGSTSKTLKKLVIVTCGLITDTGVELLSKMCNLEHLVLSFWGRTQITDIGGAAISSIRILKELRLHLLDISNNTIVAVAKNCRRLETLDLGDCLRVTGAGIRAFSDHKCLKLLALFGLSNFDQSDFECIANGCSSLQSVLLDRCLIKSLTPMNENATRVAKFTYDTTLPQFKTKWCDEANHVCMVCSLRN